MLGLGRCCFSLDGTAWSPGAVAFARRGDVEIPSNLPKGARMRKQKLGKQGPEISVVGFGAWEAGGDSYGPNPSEAEVIEAIQTALDAGIDWVDTAEIYGNGVSEQLVGKALQ